MVRISIERLESLISQIVEELPDELKTKLENIDIAIENSSPQKRSSNGITLGLYQGVPLSKRGFWYGNVLPDKITIFKDSIEALCDSEDDIEKMVRQVVIHEIAHYFGFGEKEIREAGY